jgi:hypothetical protein
MINPRQRTQLSIFCAKAVHRRCRGPPVHSMDREIGADGGFAIVTSTFPTKRRRRRT